MGWVKPKPSPTAGLAQGNVEKQQKKVMRKVKWNREISPNGGSIISLKLEKL
jgi:hypothetical protein